MRDNVAKALKWIEEDNVLLTNDVLLIADKAFFYHMLLNRFNNQIKESEWREQLILHVEKGVENSQLYLKENIPSNLSFIERMQWCYILDSLLMLAYLSDYYLLNNYKEYKMSVYEWMKKNEKIFYGFNFIYDYSYKYLLDNLNLPLPDRASFNENYEYLDKKTAFIIEAYYITHLILFESRFFKKDIDNPQKFERVWNFIDLHADTIIKSKYCDLIGEFIWCLSLGKKKESTTYNDLIEALYQYQNNDGYWTHEEYDEKVKKHATYVCTVALMDYLWGEGRLDGEF